MVLIMELSSLRGGTTKQSLKLWTRLLH
jgi:hypothetical protein